MALRYGDRGSQGGFVLAYWPFAWGVFFRCDPRRLGRSNGRLATHVGALAADRDGYRLACFGHGIFDRTGELKECDLRILAIDCPVVFDPLGRLVGPHSRASRKVAQALVGHCLVCDLVGLLGVRCAPTFPASPVGQGPHRILASQQDRSGFVCRGADRQSHREHRGPECLRLGQFLCRFSRGSLAALVRLDAPGLGSIRRVALGGQIPG